MAGAFFRHQVVGAFSSGRRRKTSKNSNRPFFLIFVSSVG